MMKNYSGLSEAHCSASTLYVYLLISNYLNFNVQELRNDLPMSPLGFYFPVYVINNQSLLKIVSLQLKNHVAQ